MDYKYNELEYAKEIYEKGFQSQQHLPTELRLVATYMRRILDYKPSQLREEFYKWCESHIDGYNRVLYYKTINSAINKATKKGSCLVTIQPVKIYQSEIDYIMNSAIINDDGCEYQYIYDCKKLMFTFLVRSKLNRQLFEQRNIDEEKNYKGISFSGGQKKYTELKKMAKLPQKLKINEDIIHYLYISELVTPLNSGILRLNYLEDLYNTVRINDLESAIEIKNFDRIGWYFDFYNDDEKIKKCEECNTVYKIKSQKDFSSKYCEECAINIKKEQDKIADKKYKAKIKARKAEIATTLEI